MNELVAIIYHAKKKQLNKNFNKCGEFMSEFEREIFPTLTRIKTSNFFISFNFREFFLILFRIIMKNHGKTETEQFTESSFYE
jgi:hypothetical protein